MFKHIFKFTKGLKIILFMLYFENKNNNPSKWIEI